MYLIAQKSTLKGTVAIPGSKSHTIRGLILASLAEGESVLRHPLDSLDTRAAMLACRAMGAEIEDRDHALWKIRGFAGKPRVPQNVLDVGNSGTTLYIILSVAALCQGGWTVLTGDSQIRQRPADKLIGALRELGAEVISTRGNSMCPLVVRGPLRGGSTSIEAITSQWVSSLLMSAPCGMDKTELSVPLLNEAPYVRMTLDWLEALGVHVTYEPDFSHFSIPGRQSWAGFDRAVAADFSSATFFLVGGAVLRGDITLTGLDMQDSQGDKAVVDYLREMGADIEIDAETGAMRVRGSALRGCRLDLNATPDALPAMAVAGALAEGETRLENVPQARVKETDRIAVMARELGKMGVKIEELEDGLVIQGRGGALKPCQSLEGHRDHRIVMALAIAGMAAGQSSRIDTAEAMSVTFPDFPELMNSLGGKLRAQSG